MGQGNKKRYAYDNGLTLVEVLASIVIISVILLGVVQLLSFANKTAMSNNSKLVTTHLAKATIERIKTVPETYFSFYDINSESMTYTKNNCIPEACENLYQWNVNDRTYEVTVKVSQTNEEKILDLINVVVTVELSGKNIKSTVEGYVIDEISEK